MSVRSFAGQNVRSGIVWGTFGLMPIGQLHCQTRLCRHVFPSRRGADRPRSGQNSLQGVCRRCLQPCGHAKLLADHSGQTSAMVVPGVNLAAVLSAWRGSNFPRSTQTLTQAAPGLQRKRKNAIVPKKIALFEQRATNCRASPTAIATVVLRRSGARVQASMLLRSRSRLQNDIAGLRDL